MPGVRGQPGPALCVCVCVGGNIAEFEEEHKARLCVFDVSLIRSSTQVLGLSATDRRGRRSGRRGLVEDALQVLRQGQDDSLHVLPQPG